MFVVIRRLDWPVDVVRGTPITPRNDFFDTVTIKRETHHQIENMTGDNPSHKENTEGDVAGKLVVHIFE